MVKENTEVDMKWIKFVLFFSVIQGCSIIPDTLKVPENTQLIPYIDVKKNAYDHEGELVRWGGEIAKVVNLKERTMIEVVNLHLNSSTRPKKKNESQGRFRLYFDGMLDPLIYTQGKLLTAVGKVKGVEKGKIGEHEYLYPVIESTGVYVWKNINKIRIDYDPLYHHSYWGHYHHRRYLRVWY